MEIHGIEITKSLEELRTSPYHQQLGQKMCAAFIAQQQGTKVDTALKKVVEPVGDLWLVIAEFARNGCSIEPDIDVLDQPFGPTRSSIM